MTSAAIPEPQSRPQNQAWEQIAFYLRQALSLFGDPAALAQRLWLSARDHQLFVQFIAPIEDMLRRLLFITALELAPMTLPPQNQAAPERKFREPRGLPCNSGAHFDPAQPESWRVCFKLAVPLNRRRQGQAQPAPAHTHASAETQSAARYSSAPCALRLEALLRAYEHRDQLAAALARKIACNTRLALDYIFKKRKRGKAPDYVTHDFAERASYAHKRFIQRRLDALKPNSS
ncbi:MAG: hypothetical protein NW206_19045 [Hyphomonadaceae bacterium]|nr:hypothetical protein [Hyphomonadaceae bacterium]